MKNAISIDVEEYFHALNLRQAFPRERWGDLPWRAEVGVDRFLRLLERTGHRGTFFVLGWVAENEPELVRRIVAEGHEVASHGYSHRMAGELGRDGFHQDVKASLAALAPLVASPVRGFRASTFSVTKDTWWALEELAGLGFEYDSSVFPVHHDRYGYPEFARTPVRVEGEGYSIVELPPLTWRVLGSNLPAAGGGYLRQFPVWYTRRAIRAMNAAGHPAVLYTHPWELDPDQPRAPAGTLGRVSALRHYRNLDSMEQRLERLLDEFEFGPTEDLLPLAEGRRWGSAE